MIFLGRYCCSIGYECGQWGCVGVIWVVVFGIFVFFGLVWWY